MSAAEVEQIPLERKLALNPDEIDVLTGVSARSVRDLIAKGVLKRVPHTSRTLVARAEVDRWLAGAEQVAS